MLIYSNLLGTCFDITVLSSSQTFIKTNSAPNSYVLKIKPNGIIYIQVSSLVRCGAVELSTM
jgi:hypothetical protein